MMPIMTHPIKSWLDANETTQEAFAADVGISRMQLWRIMNGSMPSRDTALAIQEATNGAVKAAVLLKLEDAA